MKKPSRLALTWGLWCVVFVVFFHHFHLSDYIFGKERLLAGRLRGGSSEAETKQELGDVYKFVEEKRTPETANSKSTLTLREDKAGITGCYGVLFLDFYDDKLYSTRFYPEDLNLYLAHLKDTNFVYSGTYDLLATPDIYRDGVHVWLAKDNQGRSYVGWEDTTINRNLSVPYSDNH
jgi:hypothetical protein